MSVTEESHRRGNNIVSIERRRKQIKVPSYEMRSKHESTMKKRVCKNITLVD